METFTTKYEYFPNTGEILNKRSYGKAVKGAYAGSNNKKLGYKMLWLNRKLQYAHRLIWETYRGVIPDGFQVDHIDGNGFNNKLSNLRVVSHKTNGRNQKMKSTNKSGVTGVSRTSYNTWQARITVNRKSLHLGCFADKISAINARKDAEILYGFHTNHGKMR